MDKKVIGRVGRGIAPQRPIRPPHILFVLLVTTCWAGVVQDVRALLAKGDLLAAERAALEYKQRSGETPEFLVAWSWLGRAALEAKNYDAAERYATEVYKKAQQVPLALGAAIEVRAQAAARRGERDQALAFLREEIVRYNDPALRMRIQKNINLLTLEGKRAPSLQRTEWVGPRPPALDALRGRPVLLFLWAHWCGDCKRQVTVLGEIRKAFPQLAIVAPTQRYGYAERGREVGPAEEIKYIEQVRQQYYGPLLDVPAPVSQENFAAYGVSTTPTLVLVDRQGIVRLYHPGEMTYDELKLAIERLLSRPPRYQSRLSPARQLYSPPAAQ